MTASLYAISLFAVAFYSILIAVAAWRRADQRGIQLFGWLMLCVAVWSFARGMEVVAPVFEAKLFWAKFQYLGIAPLPPLWLLFSLAYTSRLEKINNVALAALWAVPVLTLVLVVTNEQYGLLWRSLYGDSPASGTELSFAPGPWFWVSALYAYALVLAGVVLLIRAAARMSGVSRVRSILLAAGALFPLAASMLFASGLTVIDLTPIAFGLMGVVYALNIMRFQFMDIVPLARSLLVDDLDDGVLVLDMRGRIVDINRAARRFLALEGREELTGLELAGISATWARFLGPLDATNRQVEVNQPDADFEVSLSSIHDSSGQITGRLFVIHNISVRKSAERKLLESEARFRMLVETAPEAMILTDSGGSIIQANRRVSDLLGYEPGELAGKPVRRLIPAYPLPLRDGEGDSDQITRPSANGNEMTGLHRDGHEISLAVSYSPLITEKGVVYTNIFHDLTPLRRTEEQLRLQGQALNAAANGMVLTNTEGVILWVNTAFSEITGYLAKEVLGKSTRILRSGVHGQDFYRDLWTTILAGKVWQGEISNRRKDGTVYVEYQTISPVVDARGAVTHFIAIKQDITEQQAVEAKLRQRARELSIINEIGQAAASNLELSSLIQLVGDKIQQIFGPWMVYIALLDQETGLTEFPYYGVEGSRIPDPEPLGPGEGLTSVVMREGTPLLIDEDFVRRADNLGAVPTSTAAVLRPKTWIGVPIVSGEQVIGVLSVQDAEREHAYSQDDLGLLTTVAANLGVAIQNARLYQTEQERRIVAETLQQVSAALTASLKRDEVLAIILEQLKRVVHYDGASVMQWDEEKALRVVAQVGLQNPVQQDFVPTPETAPNVWKVVTDKTYWLVPDTWNDGEWKPEATQADYIRCWIGIPLIFKGEVIGLLNIESKEVDAYTERDIRIASLFADQAAIAIENSLLYEKAQFEISHRKQTELLQREVNRSLLQQIRENEALEEQLREQALRDPVTGLYNRRYLDESLPREIGRAERDQSLVGAIMMDLDHFKAINDVYGHINGDRALVALAELLNARSRPSDIACRFGGEEFCLILPGASPRAVAERAEELRAAFEAAVIHVGRSSFRVTISLGAALFPLHADSAESLVARADEALYRAKRAGRNCVIMADG